MTFNYFLFWLLTFYTHTIYHFKLALNVVITGVLGYIIASGTVGDYDNLRRSYIAVSIIIIICLAFDKHIRSVSVYFDFSNSITGPINVGRPFRKVIYYSPRFHLFELSLLATLELIKLFGGIYCIIILVVIFGKVGAFVNYCILGILVIEAYLGLTIYLIACTAILIKPYFFMYWVKWMGKWYLSRVAKCTVLRDQERLYLIFAPIDPDAESSGTPEILTTLKRKDTAIETSTSGSVISQSAPAPTPVSSPPSASEHTAISIDV